nr:BTAD domain-containing putative transcriptional regulator [Streptomyces sp. HNM0575]
MLHNAVSGLRSVLAASTDDGAHSPALLTHSPGYLLRVDPQHIDLTRFQALAEQGRAELAEGSGERAAVTLREALGLWRGQALADLVENGMEWPELAALENARMAALEDRVEADLICGRHNEIIRDLEMLAETGPPRERLCGQLMRALYLVGRQVDALSLYRRTRTALIEQLGLDPSPELQSLEHAILNHDLAAERGPSAVSQRGGSTDPKSRAAAPSTVPHPVAEVVSVPSQDVIREMPAQSGDERRTPHATAGSVEPAVESAVPSAVTEVRESEDGDTESAADMSESGDELREISAVLIMTRSVPKDPGTDPESAELIRGRAAEIVRTEVERRGGRVVGTLGPVWLAVFGATCTRETDASEAVRAAVTSSETLRRELGGSAGAGSGLVSAAVVTGEALVHKGSGDSNLQIKGPLLDRCVGLLISVPHGEVRACRVTRQVTRRSILYGPPGLNGDSPVLGLEPDSSTPQFVTPLLGREIETGILKDGLKRASRLQRLEFVTVLGDVGTGKTRLVDEFRSKTAGLRSFVVRVGEGRRTAGGMEAIADLVRVFAGIRETDLPAAAKEKLAKSLEWLVGSGNRTAWLLRHLCILLGLAADPGDPETAASSFAAWRQFCEEVVADRPTALVIEDLDRAGERMLDFVDYLASNAAPVPLLLVVTARPELLERRPGWAGGNLHATTTTLDRLSDEETAELLDALCMGSWSWREGTDTTAVLDRVGGNPLFAEEYVRHMQDKILDDLLAEAAPIGEGPAPGGEHSRTTIRVPQPRQSDTPAALPYSVRSVLASRVDALPPEVKSVLLDAAALGRGLSASSIAAMGGREMAEAVRCLEFLERRGFLRRTRRGPGSGDPEYVFAYAPVRDVAYSRLPKAVRALKHRSAAQWLEDQAGDQDLLTHHRDRASALTDARFVESCGAL